MTAPRLKVRRAYLMKNCPELGVPNEVVWVTRAVPVTLGIKGSAEWPERTEIWYAFRSLEDKTAKLLTHPSRLLPLPEAR